MVYVLLIESAMI